MANDSNFDRNPLGGCNYGLEGGSSQFRGGCNHSFNLEGRVVLHEQLVVACEVFRGRVAVGISESA